MTVDPPLDDELRPEYDLTMLKDGVRGKYAQRYREGTNLVLLTPDVANAFPTAEAVNEALRLVLRLSEIPAVGDKRPTATSERNYPCEFCDTDQPQVERVVTVARQRHGQWFIFENVQAWVCPNCGHRYFDADVLAAMEERMKARPEDARPITGWAMSLPQMA